MTNNDIDLKLITEDDFRSFDFSRVKVVDKPDKLFDIEDHVENKSTLILFIEEILNHLHLSIDGPYYSNSNENIEFSIQELEALKSISHHCKPSLFKGILDDLIFIQTKRNEYAFSAIECYLEIDFNKNDHIIMAFLKRAMEICNTNNKIFNKEKERIKEKTYNIFPKNLLGQYSILKVDKKLSKDEHKYFAEKFFENGINIINDMFDQLSKSSHLSPNIIIVAPCNIDLSFKLSADIYKKINLQHDLNDVYVNATLSLFKIVNELKKVSQNVKLENLMLQLVFLTEKYKSLSPLQSLRDRNVDIFSFYETLKTIKLSLITANDSDFIKLNMTDIYEEATCKIKKSKDFCDAITLLSNYNKGVSYESKYEPDGFDTLFKNISISNDGRTTSFNETPSFGINIYYNFHGIAIDYYISEIKNKFLIDKNKINNIVYNCASIPKEIKEYVSTGIFQWLNKDLISATFILVPLYEFLVRKIRNDNGIDSLKDNKGCQEEPSLNSTLNFKDGESPMNEDLLFELTSLLIQKNGPNLRNTIAHALIDENTLHSPICNYICWRWLCIVMGSISIYK
ncbi:TPA: DUF4209 domain-containing protein [Escherichia coli]|nr:DUF4209 domain-containing protein [Escherichia coli]HAI0123243.1 DUF4209 domain-containing protein [Escherichia coli]